MTTHAAVVTATIFTWFSAAGAQGTLSSARTPLLDFARVRTFEPIPDANDSARALRAAQHSVARLDMPREHCARSLGAKRFAVVWSELAEAHANRGENRAAAVAYRRALECSPRDPEQHAALAEQLMAAGETEAALTIVERGLAISPQDAALNRIAGEIAYLAGDFAAAAARFRTVVSEEREREQALYGQILLWLAERRAGIEEPQIVRRGFNQESWPYPIWRALRGEITEAELVDAVGEDLYPSEQERLCEALYYIGQERLARGEREIARQYFAAVVNTRVLYFIEHRMALAELERFRQGRN